MNADAFRHFYNYHFTENRTLWDNYVTSLACEQFTQAVPYSQGSVRDQIVHLMSADDTWFSGLRGLEIPEALDPADFPDRVTIRAHWDNIEQIMRAYLAALRDDMLFTKPLNGEDKDLILWQVLLHVVNHGTDHRAQLLRLLNDLGVKTTSQDYIFFVYDNPMPTSGEQLMTKVELLNWLEEEYRQWQALLAQIGPTRMVQPGVAGDWSVKDLIVHLTGWQVRLNARIQAAQSGEPEPPPPWPAHLQTDDEINAWIAEANCGRSLRAVLDAAQQVFQQLVAVIAGLPDEILIEPAYHIIQVGAQRFSASEFFDHFHDDHEADVRAWLAQVENQ